MLKRRGLVLLLLLGSALAGPVTASAAVPINVQVIVGFPCVIGAGPHNARVLATLRTPEGKVRDRATARTDGSGNFIVCFHLVFPTSNINGNDRLRIDVGAQTRFIRVPELTPMINRVQDTIRGKAEPGTPVDVTVLHYNGFKQGAEWNYSTTADGSGAWAIDTTADFNLTAFDSVTAINQVGNDLYGALASVPGIIVAHASNVVTGAVNLGTNVELTLTNSHGDLRAESTAGPFFFGRFTVEMFKSDGTGAYPTGNDWLTASIAPDAVLQMPVSGLRGSAAEDMVWGRCPANAKFQLVVRDEVYYGKADSTGRLVRDVSNRMNLKWGDQLTLFCRFPTGDVWQDTDLAL